jgi:hypothetical protein
MASTYTGLGTELMVTGEAAGTWGTKTNTNLQILEQIAGGYVAIDINGGAQTTNLAVSDGAATDANQVGHRIIEFTGAITGNQIVTIPLDVQTFYIIKNTTSDATNGYTVQLKYITGSGSSVTFAGGDRGTKLLYATANDGTNPDLVDATASLSLTSPSVITGINDVIGNELMKVTATASAVNEFTLANAATGNGPIISTTGGDAAVDLNLNPKGAGVLKSGTAAVKIAGTETMWIPATAFYLPTSNPADQASVETTATRPELKVLDFDASTAQYAQFAIAMPKSWNLGTVTYQVFWSPSTDNTDNCIFGLQGVGVAEGGTADVTFPTGTEVTDAGIGTVEDVQMTAVSGAMTIKDTPADDDLTFFQLYRDAADGSDTFTGEARVLGIKLFYTTDAANDA